MHLNPILLWANYKLNGALRGAFSRGAKDKINNGCIKSQPLTAAMSDCISKTFIPFLLQRKLLFLKVYITHIIQYNF